MQSAEDPPAVEVRVDPAGRAVLAVQGSLDVRSAPRVRESIRAWCARSGGTVRDVEIDATALDRADASGLAVLYTLIHGGCLPGVEARVRGLRPELEQLLSAFPAEQGSPAERPTWRRRAGRLVQWTGEVAVDALRRARSQVEFVGAVAEACVRRDRRAVLRWGEIARVFARGGADALPIVLLVSFLTGLVIALESAGPFSRYGARILIADTIGLAMTRELGPLMTALVVSGRTGSAFAAELGTMKVNEELDALTTMGLEPVRFLVLQRIVAGTLLTPLLTAYAMAAGILGGFVVMMSLGLSSSSIWSEMIAAVGVSDLLFGLGKALVFGATIAAVGCQSGMAAGQGASEVGRSTTRAVVSGLVLITLLDCAFAVVRQLWGS